jgi:steroid 17alpha-monooxygenase/17alpha-hydroxyprogesterone aldolase
VLSWTVAYLTKYPEIQDKIRLELDTNTQSPYLDAVLKEVLRIRPVAAIAVPHLTLEEVTVQGYTIPANSIVIANLWGALRDEEYCENAEEFRPERWVNGELAQFIPFGVGPRECVGKSLAQMVLNMTLSRICKFRMESKDVDLKPKFSLVVFPHEFHVECK